MTVLDVAHLTVRFGGNVAVDDVSLSAPLGRLTGLIGPNGAGKTTMFGAISGLVRPAAGTVRFDDRDITAWPTAARARLGIGRTFQRTELCGSLSVSDNVALGLEARMAAGNPWRQLVASAPQRRMLRQAVADAMAMCHLTSLADRTVGSLSVGQRRLVELARAHAGWYRLLLLDEVSAGLDNSETAQLGETIRGMVDDRGIGILLVEHDMALVMSVCDFLYTLDFGRLIFAGSPAETRASDVVRAAYLGGDQGLEAEEAAHEQAESRAKEVAV